MDLENIGNAVIETLDHAIGFGRPDFGQPVLNTQLLAQPVKLMVTTGLALARGKQSVCELLAVVGQNFLDPDRTILSIQCRPYSKTRVS